MEIRLNKNAVIVIQITDDMRKDYAECKRMAAIPGSHGKVCDHCCLDIPSSISCCLADILDDYDVDWMAEHDRAWMVVHEHQSFCSQAKCFLQYQGRCMSQNPPCIRPGK